MAAAQPGSPRNERLAGVTFGDIPEDSPFYGRLQGTVIYEVERGTPAWRAGLRQGDVITSVNRRQVSDTQEFIALVNGLRGQLLLRVQRGNSAAFVVIK
ncbi:MAG: PDZ domain-containing protein [Gammaproteobacteria bacterium]|nr:PDZ domain-containing protein [Gammaproteobacteria bacterium]